MKASVLKKYRDDFTKAVDLAIRECSRPTGKTDLETVCVRVKADAKMLIRRLRVLLVDEYIRVIVQKRLKKCTVNPKKAAEDAIANALQMEFDFYEMDQFRGISPRITYLEGHTVQYVEYHRSQEFQRDLSIAHLDTGIARDIARRDAEQAARNFLHPLVVRFGDLPAYQLIELWHEERRRGNGSGA